VYDKEKKGVINVENLFEIARILGKDTALGNFI
jgi:Ca2+-binding EF-hand superfamily protein